MEPLDFLYTLTHNEIISTHAKRQDGMTGNLRGKNRYGFTDVADTEVSR